MSSIQISADVEEDISSQINGTKTVFTTTNALFNVTKIIIIYNGQRLKAGSGDDYTISGNKEVTFTFAPEVSSNLYLIITI